MIAVAVDEFELRCRPTQDRSIATFESILAAAASVLESTGFEAFTTNLVAERSGLSVRALYRYFPNKHSLVVELARRMSNRWGSAVAEVGVFEDVSLKWRPLWLAYIDAFVDSVRTTPGGRAVLLAMREDPDLRRLDDRANAAYIDGITDALMARRPSLGIAEARSVATVLMRSMVAVLDDAFEIDPSAADGLIDVLKAMQMALLEKYLD